MALPFGDNGFTKFFTPKEYQVDLLEAAKNENIIACIGNSSSRTFISLKLLQELSIAHRKNKRRKFTLFIVESTQQAVQYSSAVEYLTDLRLNDLTLHTLPFKETVISAIACAEVILVTSLQAWELISTKILTLDMIYLLIVDDCHHAITTNHVLNKLMNSMQPDEEMRIFGMMFPLYTTSGISPGKTEANLNELQNIMRCRVETASDIVSILRYNCKPNEYLIECDMRTKDDLDHLIMSEISNTVEFLNEHRYDPSEIYEGELLEELQSIGDPIEEPLHIIYDFIYVLNTMGTWCANKAALASLFVIEKLKLKTPYERHFLLLGVVSSLMLKIRTIFDKYFSKFPDEDQLYKFISPKVQRLIEIFRCYKPSERPIQELKTNVETLDEDSKDKIEEITDPNSSADNKTATPLTICDSYVRYKHDKANRTKNKKKYQTKTLHSKQRLNSNDCEVVCCVIFVRSRLIATVVHYLLADLKKLDNDNFWWLSPQFTVEKTADIEKEPRDAEIQHRNLEDVLRKFRTKDCNILIGTSMLEEGIDLPKCNLVIRFDIPHNFCSYVYSKSKACANYANFFIMYELSQKSEFIDDLARYYQIEQLLLNRCVNKMENARDLQNADKYTGSVAPYMPVENEDTLAYVNLENAIACINRYCAKLPSDSFTRLTPSWTTSQVTFDNMQCFVSTIRLPINSPYKKIIYGHPMPTEILSRRIVALEACRVLHLAGELDDKLLPIGKESFHLLLSSDELVLDEADQLQALNETDARPGTNKRRQYYRRRIAKCFTRCQPAEGIPLYLYSIKMVLSCPLPEEQNTRGRRIHAPEDSMSGFGILLSKKIPKICAFPIFIRCGEVMVSIELVSDKLFLEKDQLERMSSFLNYTFTKVLRLHKYFMTFDPANSPSSYYIVPTFIDASGDVKIDWNFADRIYQHKSEELKVIPDDERMNFSFHKHLYSDAVVMPWYRNQDFPQHFYVAEICWTLSPRSEFPGIEYKTFEEYYFRKYQLKIQNLEQPLLDVDHTSMRLNFLTPRYVNRKGVALPTCSEATKKAKRESLAQKQILVPELCQIHMFPASLWRKAVALPCIMYRLNCLLLAEEIRNQVSCEIDLGLNTVPEDFEWEPLNFGWTLADVVRRTNEMRLLKAQKEGEKEDVGEACEQKEDLQLFEDTNQRSKKRDDFESMMEESSDGEPFMEIGTWSNEMAGNVQTFSDEFEGNLPTFTGMVRYGSPTNWLNDAETDMDMESIVDSESSTESYQNPTSIRIEFRNEFLAEAIDQIEECSTPKDTLIKDEWLWENSNIDANVRRETKRFEDAVQKHRKEILNSSKIVNISEPLCFKPFERCVSEGASLSNQKLLTWCLSADTGYGMPTSEILREKSMQNGHSPVSSFSREENRSRISELIDTNGENITASELVVPFEKCTFDSENPFEIETDEEEQDLFSFDYQPDLTNHVGPSPNVLLQALTMSNANDGINLERLETIGDSFLKYAITNYLYSTHDNVHEGKLSHIRSKQVSNLHLYKLGNRKMFGECMIASKFEPHDNWLPPCFRIACALEEALIENKASSCFWKVENLPLLWNVTADELFFERKSKLEELSLFENNEETLPYLPFHLITYHNIPDKSIADCVEALIGAYLISCGIRGALLFMSWLGIKVLPALEGPTDGNSEQAKVEYGYLHLPPSPLVRNVQNPEEELDQLMVGYDQFERILRYRFNDRSYLLQAMTHASYSPNRVTDCYQRLEFLGDAVLDYLITRHLYEDKRQHTPGALTDLRSALVNNTIFAALAVRFGFHKYFRHLSPGLADVIHRFVRIQEENDHTIFEEYYLINEEECEEVEDVEVPKALGDIFESVAGAVFLDSGMSLDAVWKVYYRIMKNEIEQFSTNVPKSPIRELLEMEPETAKFGRPEKLADGKRVRVTVEVFGKGMFKGIGRNYRIAKCTAAKCALKQLKKRGLVSSKQTDSRNN